VGVDARTFGERVRGSLFFVPMLYVLGGVVVGQLSIVADQHLGDGLGELPLAFTSTVESARSVLSTVAAATITVAGIAFSVALLIFQLASSQYSPRVVHGLFRDPFNKQVMGIVLGTFTYCLTVLRSVRDAVSDSGEPVVPNLSVTLAVVFGVVAISAIVAFIDHSAHRMDVSAILAVATNEALQHAPDDWVDADGDPGGEHAAQHPIPSGASTRVSFAEDGWIRDLDVAALMSAVPPGSTVRCETDVGRYAIAGTSLCTVWPAIGDDPAVVDSIRSTARLGQARTLENDVTYGLRQLADVALKALSPGVNDPTTAQDAIFHQASILAVLLDRVPSRHVMRDDDDRILLLTQRPTPTDLIDLAFDEVRRAAAPHPSVCVYLLEMISLLLELVPRDDPRGRALCRQADLVVAGAERENLLPADLTRVKEIYDRHFH
jgi:uncharacterized membrane protein